MKRLIILLLFGALCSGCAVSGGGTSGTGLDYGKKCKPGQVNCCLPETDCIPAKHGRTAPVGFAK